METLAEIRVALNAASDRLERGLLRQSPREFLDDLWNQVYAGAPADLQPYVWSRLIELGEQLQPFAPPPADWQPPVSHYRL